MFGVIGMHKRTTTKVLVATEGIVSKPDRQVKKDPPPLTRGIDYAIKNSSAGQTSSLLDIIEPASDLHQRGIYIQHFTRPKPVGSLRLIATLKPINKFIMQQPFEMLEVTQIR